MSAIETELFRRRMAGFMQVGMRVHYHPVINESHDGRVYTVRAVDAELGRVWLEGKAEFVIAESVSMATESGEG